MDETAAHWLQRGSCGQPLFPPEVQHCTVFQLLALPNRIAAQPHMQFWLAAVQFTAAFCCAQRLKFEYARLASTSSPAALTSFRVTVTVTVVEVRTAVADRYCGDRHSAVAVAVTFAGGGAGGADDGDGDRDVEYRRARDAAASRCAQNCFAGG